MATTAPHRRTVVDCSAAVKRCSTRQGPGRLFKVHSLLQNLRRTVVYQGPVSGSLRLFDMSLTQQIFHPRLYRSTCMRCFGNAHISATQQHKYSMVLQRALFYMCFHVLMPSVLLHSSSWGAESPTPLSKKACQSLKCRYSGLLASSCNLVSGSGPELVQLAEFNQKYLLWQPPANPL